MKIAGIAGFAALFCLGLAAPALAAWDSLGRVNVDGRPGTDRDARTFNMGGPVERLQLRAERSDIECRSVRARFGNGNRRDIFHGRLREGRTVDIDMPGNARNLNRLAFACTALDRRGGTIRISADVGRYRNDWMRGPNWRSTWARMFNWGSNMANDWRLVGTERFEGRRDSERAFTGWRGVNADAVALKPLEADARCNRVVARFRNGRSQSLSINHGDILRRGMYYKLDLPGRQRDLTSLTLRCSAVGAGRVSVQIFTSR
jgi:hypothetical protein